MKNEPIFAFTDEHNDTVSYYKEEDGLSAELVRGDLQHQSYEMTASEILDKVSAVEQGSNYTVTVPLSDEHREMLENMEKEANAKDITD